jgi:hypothetical protein
MARIKRNKEKHEDRERRRSLKKKTRAFKEMMRKMGLDEDISDDSDSVSNTSIEEEEEEGKKDVFIKPNYVIPIGS